MQKGKNVTPHIGIYGRRNNGKSSMINQLAGQDIAIVSDFAGTTTDPVKKSFEITGFGPVILIDTAGIDDVGELGQKRIEKTIDTIKTVDLGILVIANNQFGDFEKQIIENFKKQDVPFFIIHNKSDLNSLQNATVTAIKELHGCLIIEHSAVQSQSTNKIIDSIVKTIPEAALSTPTLVGDLVSYGDIVLLITPIDIEAPEGRLILPQIQTIRDLLDNDAVCVVLKEREVDAFLKKSAIKPALAITDSQIFNQADASVPRDIPLTSFSILLARFKGDFAAYLQGTPKISSLKDNDRILLLESCSHHVACDDIGRVKIPRWLSAFTGKHHEFDVVSGLNNLPRPMEDYALVIQCGGCMITRKQLINRIRPAIEAGIPVTNYGMAIAYVQGIYNRAVAPFTLSSSNGTDYL